MSSDSQQTLDEAFPAVDSGLVPFGSRVLVQIRTPKKKSRGGLIIVDEARETDRWNTQIGKVVALGPLAFHNRNTLTPWPEGAWCKQGDFVRVPKYGGDRWMVPVPGTDEEALFVIFNDLDIVGGVTGDPLAIKAFL